MGSSRTMQCVFIGCCFLTLVNLSVSQLFFQKPRFLGVRSHRDVFMSCKVPDPEQSGKVQWYKSSHHGAERRGPIVESTHYSIENSTKGNSAWIRISKVQPEDSGIYYCKCNGTFGPGTELQVHRHVNVKEAVRRSNMKDVMIIIQAILLVSCLLGPLLFHLYRPKSDDFPIYEEPEADHTYEGLEIEHCGLYEDIPALSQPAEATWEQTEPETPCQE